MAPVERLEDDVFGGAEDPVVDVADADSCAAVSLALSVVSEELVLVELDLVLEDDRVFEEEEDDGKEEPGDSTASRSAVALRLPHCSFCVQACCACASLGLLPMHCSNVCWHMNQGSVEVKAVQSGTVPLEHVQLYVRSFGEHSFTLDSPMHISGHVTVCERHQAVRVEESTVAASKSAVALAGIACETVVAAIMPSDGRKLPQYNHLQRSSEVKYTPGGRDSREYKACQSAARSCICSRHET